MFVVVDHRAPAQANFMPVVRDHQTLAQAHFMPVVRDHRTPAQAHFMPVVRDYRTPAQAHFMPVVRDHRTPAQAHFMHVVRDHRTLAQAHFMPVLSKLKDKTTFVNSVLVDRAINQVYKHNDWKLRPSHAQTYTQAGIYRVELYWINTVNILIWDKAVYIYYLETQQQCNSGTLLTIAACATHVFIKNKSLYFFVKRVTLRQVQGNEFNKG
ncbi:hypothetical protein CHS0354_030318 [Potamilus streckersoni]|uniref:Uncharacterized protein n=1 Tax=Potamilus streckersoni TaxID=2493646 RepID=A0AAE0T457_9BIVA|nr:hypothetical protein CHS0354_030318 [Potamilus streckersoni]